MVVVQALMGLVVIAFELLFLFLVERAFQPLYITTFHRKLVGWRAHGYFGHLSHSELSMERLAFIRGAKEKALGKA